MRFIQGTPNPNGMTGAELFLLTGSATPGPVEQIEADPAWNLLHPAAADRNVPFRLRVLHFNDMHGFISNLLTSYERPILSRIVSHVKELRRRYLHHPHVAVLFVAGGDEQTGSPFDELLGHNQASCQTHAGYRAYSAAGVDVGVIGNHDLDKGPDLLAHAIQQEARFPILSANVLSSRYLNRLGYPAALFRVKGVRIGLIGLTTAGQIRCPNQADFTITHPLEAIQNLLPAFKPYCDIVIILSHLGYSAASDSAIVKPIGDVELAAALNYCDVDLIIGGHTHHILNEEGLSPANIVNGIPIVQAGRRGRFLGSVDIGWRYGVAAVSSVRLMMVDELPVDQDFETQVIQPLIKQARPILETPLGALADDPGLSTPTVNNLFAVEEVPLVNFITDGLVARCRAHHYPVDLALVDAADIGCGLPSVSQVTLGMWLRMMPFADTIQLCWLTGHQLKNLLDDNAHRIDLPDEPHTERGFLQFSQALRYTINIIKGRRTECNANDITMNGRPLDEQLDKTFMIAYSSFVRHACAFWEKQVANKLHLIVMSLESESINRFDTGLTVSQELIAYVRAQGGVTPASGAKRDGRLQIKAHI